MAVTVAWLGNGRQTPAESTTGFTALKISGTGGGPTAAVSDIFIQGTTAVTCVVSRQHVVLYYDVGAGNTLDFTAVTGAEAGEAIHAWGNMVAAGAINVRNSGGFGAFCESNAPGTGQYKEYYFYGSDNYQGGFKRMRWDPNETASATAGTALSVSAVRYIGVFADVGGNTTKFDNLVLDAIDVGIGIYCYGTATTDDLKGDLLADEATTRYGIFTALNDSETAIELGGVLEMGDAAASNNTSITDIDANIFVAEPLYYDGTSETTSLPLDFFKINIEEGGGTTGIQLGKAVGTGDDGTGRNGWLVVGNSSYDVDFNIVTEPTSDFYLYGCKLQNLTGTIALSSDTSHEIKGTTFDGCAEVDAVGGCIIRNCFFSNHSDTSPLAALLWNTSIDIKNCIFINNDIAIAIPQTVGSDETFDNLLFSGNTLDFANTGTAGSEATSNVTNTANQVLGNGTVIAIGQSFTTLGSPGDLSHIILSLRKVLSPTGTITIELFAEASDIDTGAALATATKYYNPTTDTTDDLTAQILTTGYVDYTIIFASGENFNFAATTKYVIKVSYANGNASNYVQVEYDDNTTNNYTGGRRSTDVGAGLVLDNTNEDYRMIVRVNNWVHIFASNGANPSTWLGTTASFPAAATVENAVTLQLEFIDENGLPIQNVQGIIQDQTTGALYMNEDSTAGGISSEPFNYPGSTVDIVWKARKSNTADNPRYISQSGLGQITANGFTLQVVMKENDALN